MYPTGGACHNRGRSESAGGNRHGVGGESPLRRRSSDPLRPSYASTSSDGVAKRWQRYAQVQ